jgi:copper chaperone CopZ
MIDIVILAVLAAVVGLLIRGMMKNEREGKSSCGGSCVSCGACHFEIPDAKTVKEANTLYETRVSVDGMMCGMCEAHVNDAVRKAVSPKKVSSSHSKGQTIVVTLGKPDLEAIRKAIDETGYTVTGIASEPQ